MLVIGGKMLEILSKQMPNKFIKSIFQFTVNLFSHAPTNALYAKQKRVLCKLRTAAHTRGGTPATH